MLGGRVAIAGAGVTGLTAAIKLAKRHEVTVFEKGDEPGGLARTLWYGGFGFDLGPHRILGQRPEATDYVRSVAKDDILRIKPKGMMYLDGNYLRWPLRHDALAKIPMRVKCGAVVEAFRPSKKEVISRGDYLRRKYGRTLTDFFFRRYIPAAKKAALPP
ncbi:MAG: FAD-dependent oxidoreductase [Candidatus Altiarchaeota archaeon]